METPRSDPKGIFSGPPYPAMGLFPLGALIAWLVEPAANGPLYWLCTSALAATVLYAIMLVILRWWRQRRRKRGAAQE